MYNRYIPQADGTYQRSRIPDVIPPQPTPPSNPVPPPPCPSPPPQPQTRSCPPPRPRPRPSYREPEKNVSVSSFLKQLLPKDFDTGDLLVMLLLLLISGDCQEDQNTALLTLALYLFL